MVKGVETARGVDSGAARGVSDGNAGFTGGAVWIGGVLFTGCALFIGEVLCTGEGLCTGGAVFTGVDAGRAGEGDETFAGVGVGSGRMSSLARKNNSLLRCSSSLN